MKTNRNYTKPILIVVFIFAAAALGFQPAWCNYPEQAITIYVGMNPGGGTDLAARALAPAMSTFLGVPVVIENKPGGGGTVALGLIENVKPDGNTLAVAHNVSIVDTALMQKVTFKPLASITPLSVFCISEHTSLLVKSDAPWKTFKEFIDYAKANPGKIKYSSAGVGTGMHVAMETIARKEGIKWVHVPYKGTPAARVALLGGHVDAQSSGADWPPYVQSGQLRVLATHGEERFSLFPDVPTLKEMGYDFVSDTLFSLFGPPNLPDEIVKKLDKAVREATNSPEFKQVIERIYYGPRYMDSAEYKKHLKDKWGQTEKTFKELGIITEAATSPY